MNLILLILLSTVIFRNFLQFNFSLESRQNISSSVFQHFDFGELLYELVDRHVAAADADLNIIGLVHLDVDASLAKLVDTFGFSKEQNFHIVSLWILIKIIRKYHVCAIAVVANVYLMIFTLHFANLHEQLSYFLLSIAQFIILIFESRVCFLQLCLHLLHCCLELVNNLILRCQRLIQRVNGLHQA